MNVLKVMPRVEESGPSSPQSRRRRASAITVRIRVGGADSTTRSPDVQAAAIRGLPEPAGSLLLFQDAAEERPGLVKSARLAGLQVVRATTPEEALQLLMDKDFAVDLFLVIPRPSRSSPAAVLIRKSLEIRPGLQVLMMIDAGGWEEMRAGYEAGTASIILQSTPADRVTLFLKQSLSVAREGGRQELRRRERRERHASDSPARRVIRRIKSWVAAPRGSRRKTALAAMATGAVALLIGMGLAFALDHSYRVSDRHEAMTNRVLEGMNRSGGSTPRQAAAVLIGQTWEQTGLGREANEATRRYQEDHLQELRWQNYSRSRIPSEPVANPPPDPRMNVRR